MKKLLSILASVGLVATSATAVVSCTSIHNTGNDTIDADGGISFQTKNELRIAKGTNLGTKGEDGFYTIADADKNLGDVLTPKDSINGIAMYMVSNKDGASDINGDVDRSALAAGTTFKVDSKYIKDADIDKAGKTTKELDAYIQVTIPHGDADADGNFAGHKFFAQDFSWSIIAYDSTHSKIQSWVEISQIHISRATAPAINGMGTVDNSGSKTIVSIPAENLNKLSSDDINALKTNVKVDGATVDKVDISTGNLVITFTGKLANGTYNVIIGDSSTATANGDGTVTTGGFCDAANTASFVIAEASK